MEELKAEREKELVESRNEKKLYFFPDRTDVPQSMKAMGNMSKKEAHKFFIQKLLFAAIFVFWAVYLGYKCT